MSLTGPLLMGIDGGGSKCRALLVDENNAVLGRGQSGPGNPNQGLEPALQSITTCAQQALANAGLPADALGDVTVGLGLAGVNLPRHYQQVSTWQHPFKAMTLATDLHIACLGAHGGQDGAVIITGTGSCGMVNVNGNTHEFGGHGFLVGDQGSGAWLGINAIRYSLQALDGLLPKTEMVGKLLAKAECRNAQELAQVMAHVRPSDYARFAPLVVEQANQKDELATKLLIEGTEYINRLARRLFSYEPPRFAMIGGLAPIIEPWLDEDVRNRVSPSLHSPEMGAVLLARQFTEE